MSEENLEVVRRYFGSPGDVVALFADDEVLAELVAAGRTVAHPDFHVYLENGLPETREGIEGLVETWREMLTGWEHLSADIEELREIDEGRVLALGSARGRTERDGVEVEIPTGAIYCFRGSKLWRVEYYTTQARALEAAGLSE
jgi:hypothetical protein